MTRPTVLHDGFLVPNAAGVSNPRMSEPDQIDFSTVANALWGVIEDCKVTVSGTMATTLGGVVVINGMLITVARTDTPLGVSGSLDRFDLLVAHIDGTMHVVPGVRSTDPVYPDVPKDSVLLAAVFCPTGGNDYSENVIDKRRLVSKALLTKIANTDELIRNVNGNGNYFLVLGDGTMVWAGDTRVFRAGVKTLRIEDHLQVTGTVVAGGDITGQDLIARNLVRAPNLNYGHTAPTETPLGALWQRDDGHLYLNTAAGWKELMTSEGAVPVGSVIQSMEVPAVMTPLGWLPLDGVTVINEQQNPALFTVTTLAPFITGVSPNRSMRMPDATDRVLMRSGAVGSTGGSRTIALALAQMPSHVHNVRVQLGGGAVITGRIGRSGIHAHAVWGGAHTHPVSDPGHSHNGGEYPAGAFVCLVWGGQNKVDALFNDRNHTYSVESVQWSRPATTNIQISSAGSEHNHDMDQQGDHDHPLTVDSIQPHTHGVLQDAVGGGAPINIVPQYLSVYTYIRS